MLSWGPGAEGTRHQGWGRRAPAEGITHMVAWRWEERGGPVGQRGGPVATAGRVSGGTQVRATRWPPLGLPTAPPGVLSSEPVRGASAGWRVGAGGGSREVREGGRVVPAGPGAPAALTSPVTRASHVLWPRQASPAPGGCRARGLSPTPGAPLPPPAAAPGWGPAERVQEARGTKRPLQAGAPSPLPAAPGAALASLACAPA